MFSKETYIQRRAELKRRVGSGVLLFLGNDHAPMNYADNTYSFRQDSTFLYYFGLDFDGLAAVIDIDEGSDIIFGNDPTIDDIVWMGSSDYEWYTDGVLTSASKSGAVPSATGGEMAIFGSSAVGGFGAANAVRNSTAYRFPCWAWSTMLPHRIICACSLRGFRCRFR